MANVPDGLRYTDDHEWVKVDGDIATVGITDFAQGELGDVVFIELPEADDDFEQGDAFGSIEAVKTVADMLAPVSGTITEVNSELEDEPEKINSDPFGDGWIVKIKLSDPAELDSLMDTETYKTHIA